MPNAQSRQDRHKTLMVDPGSDPTDRRHRVSTAMRMLFVFVFLSMFAFPVMAKDDPCKSLKDELTRLKQEYQNAKSDWQSSNDGERGGRRRPVMGGLRMVENEYRPRIQAAQRKYDQCRFENGGVPDLPATLTGNVRMTTTHSNSSARGPFDQSITIELRFLKYEHRTVDVSLTPLSLSYSTPLGPNTTTVSLTSVRSTSVNPANGSMTIGLNLHFGHSVTRGQDSDLFIELSTENPGGSRINRSTRQVSLVGTGTFSGGYLGDSDCTLIIRGTLSALPSLPE